jgi:hypothetical protein
MKNEVATTAENKPLSQQAAANAPTDPNHFEFDGAAIVDHLSVPVLSYKEPGAQIGFQIVTRPYEGEPLEGQSDQKPVTLIDVNNLVNGGRYHVVVGAVLARTLDALEKSGGMVGQCLAVRNAGTKKSRTDRNVTLLDIVRLDPSHPACALADPSLIDAKAAK